MGELHAGDNICVRFLEDGKWYPATVAALATDGATVEYPQTKEFLACEEELPLADLVRPTTRSVGSAHGAVHACRFMHASCC
jgi:hypothetical protein